MRHYLAGPRGKPAAVGSSAAIQRQSFAGERKVKGGKKKKGLE